MQHMRELNSESDIREFISENRLVLGYFSAPDCGVCTALKPKMLSMLEEFPHIASFYVDVRKQQVAAAAHSIFTIPGILVFSDGKESMREARFVHLDEFKTRLERLNQLMFNQE